MSAAGWLWRRTFASVRVRVAVVAAGVFALTLVIASAALLHALESRLVDDIRQADETALQTRALTVAREGLPAEAGEAAAIPGTGGSVAFRVDQPDGTTIVVSGPATGMSDVIATNDGVYADHVMSGAELANGPFQLPIDPVSARLLGISAGRGPFLVSTLQLDGISLSTASSLAAVENTLATTRAALWIAVPALVLLVAVLAWLVVGRALRPVHAVTSQVAVITAQSLHERVPVPVVADEVGELALTMNSMLDRLETSTQASRQLVSDASHELRTPIAVMRAELEVARRDPDPEWDVVSASLLGEVDRLQSLVDDLLLLAQMAERRVEAEPVALDAVVHEVAARRRRVEVRVVDEADDAVRVVRGDPMAVHRALDHIVANAARHAVGVVEVRVIDDGGDTVVVVDDDGPGIDEEQRGRVVERFVRLDEARSRDAGGSGLGLAVAADVMRLHGGSLRITTAPLGGARVELRFPQPVAVGVTKAV